jgi:hypothetical protein
LARLQRKLQALRGFAFLTSPQPLSILERGFFLLLPKWREAGKEVSAKVIALKNSYFSLPTNFYD